MEEGGQGWRRPSRTWRRLRADSAKRGLQCSAAALPLIVISPPAPAAELPRDVWSGKYRGVPSITADAEGSVSMDVPAGAVQEAGGGSVAPFAGSFLEKWASGTCFGISDFQSSHKNLRVRVAMLRFSGRLDFDDVPGARYTTSDCTDGAIDYITSNRCEALQSPRISVLGLSGRFVIPNIFVQSINFQKRIVASRQVG